MKPHPKIVTAFTLASNEHWLPPQCVVGELVVRHVPTLGYYQYLVDGVGVDETTVTPLTDPTPEMLRILGKKRSEWARQDRELAERRAREDDSFREEKEDEEYEVHLVRKDRQEAFSAFCDAMNSENLRLTGERRGDVRAIVEGASQKDNTEHR
jgi:hypothetical protein